MAEKPKRLERFLMSGADAQNPENHARLFEALKDRSATPEESAELARAVLGERRDLK
jgi:hypothetical protein